MNHQQKSVMNQMDYDALQKYKTELSAESARMVLMSRELDTEIVKEMLRRQTDLLRRHQESYFTIDCTAHPNVVMAKLAGMIGAERTIRDALSFYDNPKNRKNELDDAILICDDILKAKEREVLAKRK